MTDFTEFGKNVIKDASVAQFAPAIATTSSSMQQSLEPYLPSNSKDSSISCNMFDRYENKIDSVSERTCGRMLIIILFAFVVPDSALWLLLYEKYGSNLQSNETRKNLREEKKVFTTNVFFRTHFELSIVSL